MHHSGLIKPREQAPQDQDEVDVVDHMESPTLVNDTANSSSFVIMSSKQSSQDPNAPITFSMTTDTNKQEDYVRERFSDRTYIHSGSARSPEDEPELGELFKPDNLDPALMQLEFLTRHLETKDRIEAQAQARAEAGSTVRDDEHLPCEGTAQCHDGCNLDCVDPNNHSVGSNFPHLFDATEPDRIRMKYAPKSYPATNDQAVKNKATINAFMTLQEQVADFHNVTVQFDHQPLTARQLSISHIVPAFPTFTSLPQQNWIEFSAQDSVDLTNPEAVKEEMLIEAVEGLNVDEGLKVARDI